MRARAEEVQGRPLDARSSAAFTSLQRQVAQTLAQGFRSDRGDAQARYAAYGEHLATLQRHPVSAPVARVVLGLIPPAEHLPLQRAVDETLQRFQAQERASLNFDTLQTLQRQLAELDAEATQPVLARIQARRGSGNPLPEAVQRHLEQGLNHDLSRVRIHDDAEADKLAKGVNAIAFTTGTDIFFQSGQFNPNTQSGLELLAHEVTHTVQQSQGRVGTGIDPDAGLESEARTMGARLAHLVPPVTRPNPHAPGLYSSQAALKRVQAEAVTATLHRPFEALGMQRQVTGGLTIQRNFVLDKLSDFAANIPGYRPLCLAFGKDLVTGKSMAQNPNAILDALANYVPGPLKDILRVIRSQNLIPKAWTWFQAELGKLRLSRVPGEIKGAIAKFPPDLGAARAALTGRANGLKQLVTGSVRHITQIALTAIEAGLGPVGKKVMSLLRKGGDVVTQVLRDPAKFASNLLKALKQGFTQFRTNAGKWLKNGLGQWLTGASGIAFPATLDLKGVFLTALSVMGLTYQAMRGRLVRELGADGARQVALAEQAGGSLMALKGGLHHAPELKAQQGPLGRGVVDSLKAEVTQSLVTAGAAKVASLLIPGGAFVQALLTAFRGVQTLVSQGGQIMGVIMSALGSVQSIAAGQVGAAAGFVERAIGGSVPIVLTFLGKLVGLGSIGTRIRSTVIRLRQRLDGAMAGLMKRMTASVRKLGGRSATSTTNASSRSSGRPVPARTAPTPATPALSARGPAPRTPRPPSRPPTHGASRSAARPAASPTPSSLHTRGTRPAAGTRDQAAATAHRTATQQARQADFDRFNADKRAELLRDQPNLTEKELQAAVRQQRQRTQLRGQDVHRLRYHQQAPTGRMAQIDARAQANYHRVITQQIERASDPHVYRYTTRDTANNWYQNGIQRPSYMTDTRFGNNRDSMDRAQVAEAWGVHDVGLRIPREAIKEVVVPRPFGNHPAVKLGWETSTHAYPEYGRGHALQFLGRTEEYSKDWEFDLDNTYTRKGRK